MLTPLIVAASLLQQNWLLKLTELGLEFTLKPLAVLQSWSHPYWGVSPPLAVIGLYFIGFILWLAPYCHRLQRILGLWLLAAPFNLDIAPKLKGGEAQIIQLSNRYCGISLINTLSHHIGLIILPQPQASLTCSLNGFLPLINSLHINKLDYLITNYPQDIQASLSSHSAFALNPPASFEISLDGVAISPIYAESELAVLIKSKHELIYIGSGIKPPQFQPLDQVIISYPLSKFTWIYSWPGISNLGLNYPPTLSRQITAFGENLFLSEVQITDLSYQGHWQIIAH
jgi:hypothetical protein